VLLKAALKERLRRFQEAANLLPGFLAFRSRTAQTASGIPGLLPFVDVSGGTDPFLHQDSAEGGSQPTWHQGGYPVRSWPQDRDVMSHDGSWTDDVSWSEDRDEMSVSESSGAEDEGYDSCG